jgi:hypothetical protein
VGGLAPIGVAVQLAGIAQIALVQILLYKRLSIRNESNKHKLSLPLRTVAQKSEFVTLYHIQGN